jgi:acetate kinase
VDVAGVGPARVLVVNAGSSSLKLRVLQPDFTVVDTEDLPAPRGRADESAIAAAIERFGRVEAVGHRIVHGGGEFSGPVLIDARVKRSLRALIDLAPLHQPKSLAAVDVVDVLLGGIPSVACFDTAFHASIPPAAATYALPREWRKRWNLKRYGFHGLSHSYASRRAGEILERSLDGLRVITCHLGAGASLAAVRDGRSVDTTMGFTPLEGLVMATRSGTVDPGLVLWLEEHADMPSAELAAALEHRSGLLGLAGISDMRQVLAAAGRGDPDASLARDAYVHRVRGAIGSMAAAMGGVECVVFTGGVGENSAEVRRLVLEDLTFLGISVDPSFNAASRMGDRDISAPDARVSVLVVAAREDIEIAREVRSTLESGMRAWK